MCACIYVHACLHSNFHYLLSAGIPFVPHWNETALIVGSDVGSEEGGGGYKKRLGSGRKREGESDK